MRALFIAPEYPPHNVGGGGIVIQDLAQSLSKMGHDITVISGYYPTKSPFERIWRSIDGGVDVYWMPLMPAPKSSYQLKTVMPPNLNAIINLLKIIHQQNFDVIQMHGFGHLLVDISAFLCKRRGLRYILTLHGFPHSPLTSANIIGLLYRIYTSTIGKFTLSMASEITAVSSEVRNEAIGHGADLDVTIVPNGIDLSKYQLAVEDGDEFRAKYGIWSTDHLLVTVGILHERKGFQHLIEALSLIKARSMRVKLLIIGRDGGYGPVLRNLIKRLHVEDVVNIIGYVDFRTKLMAINEADILIIPSLIEPFGIVALEGMALGKAIVATKIGGLKEVLDDGVTAVMVKPASGAALAQGIIEVLNDEVLKKGIMKRSKEKVRKYDWREISRHYLDVYERVTTGAP